MATHNYIINNAIASAVRTDLNNALQAIVSVNSGSAYPATTYANMLVYRTDTHTLQKRNEANSAWITLGTVGEAASTFDPAYTYATNADATTGTDNTKVATILRARQTVSILLGTLVTTSGTTQTLSGLDLTTFRELHIFFKGVSSTTAPFSLTLAGIQITAAATDATTYIRGTGIIDLGSGVCSFDTAASGVAPISVLGASYSGDLSITTATTSLVFGTSVGTFDNGNIRVIGYR